jgi:hypothetical protein
MYEKSVKMRSAIVSQFLLLGGRVMVTCKLDAREHDLSILVPSLIGDLELHINGTGAVSSRRKTATDITFFRGCNP